MKILLLTNLFYENPTARVILEGLGRAYAGMGHEVVAAGQYRQAGDRHPVVESVSWGRVERLGGTSQDRARRARQTLQRLPALAAWADLVHVQWAAGWSLAGPFAQALERSRARVCFSIQDYDHPLSRPPKPTRVRDLDRLLSASFRVTANSRFTASALAAGLPRHGRRAKVVPNGFDPDEVARACRAIRRRSYVLCVARLLPYKGIDLLLMAWRDLCESWPGVELVLCGPDPWNGRFQGLARSLRVPRVRFLGERSHRRALSLMKSSLFFVLPSRVESFGIAALEAMACGKAVLATSCGPADFVTHGRTGLLARPGDSAALQRDMARLIEDGRLRSRLGVAARRAAANFTWDAVAGTYLRHMGFEP